MDALCPGNVLFGHAENEMSVNPFCLFVRQTGNRRMKLLHGHFPLIQFMGRYCPKATVQAAIGSIPLGMGLACGDIVLTVAVLSILITAPLGAFAIDCTYQRLLKKN